LFDVVKLVHVARNDFAAAATQRAEIAQRRRRSIVRLLETLNEDSDTRFDAKLFDRVYAAIVDAGVASWYPIVGFDYHPATGRFTEFSFYCADAPGRAAAAVACVLGLPAGVAGPTSGEDLHALGFDVVATGQWRFKPYRQVPSSVAASVLGDLDADLHALPCLSLRRTSSEGTCDALSKFYIELFTRDGCLPPYWGEDLPKLTTGRINEFARKVAPALTRQQLFYVGASAEKIEIYLGVFPPR
jgi:hypothetical protein